MRGGVVFYRFDSLAQACHLLAEIGQLIVKDHLGGGCTAEGHGAVGELSVAAMAAVELSENG
jgi:hypothetical protein